MLNWESARRSSQTVLAHLQEDRCRHCEDGTLEVATYKGNVALVCDACGTPKAQFWTPHDVSGTTVGDAPETGN